MFNPDDLVKFGLIPEFVGRFTNWVVLQELDISQLVNIMCEVKNSWISQYQWIFAQDQIELDFTPEALQLIAERAKSTRTGARALHSELERILLPHMYNLRDYNKKQMQKVNIDVDLVNNPTHF